MRASLPADSMRDAIVGDLHQELVRDTVQVGAALARTRYRQVDQACIVERLDSGTLELAFEKPQRAVTPGQSVVLYDGDCCLGGGIIELAE